VRLRGEGTIYRETDPKRKTKFVAEKRIVLPGGKRKRLVVRGYTEKDVLAKLRAKERELQTASPDADRLTLNQYLDEWLQYKEPLVKRRTFLEYQATLRHARRIIGDVRLSRVTPRHVQQVLDELLRAGTPTQAANVRRYLRQAFRQAERWELLHANPVRNIEPVKVPPIKRGVLQPHEIDAMLTFARNHEAWLYPLLHTAVFTGLRHGELLALPAVNVQEDHIVVDRTQSLHDPRGFERPKTAAANRSVPIAPATYRVIMEGRSYALNSPYAFPSTTGTPLQMRNVYRAWNAVKKEMGLDLRIHDLRRTAASLWARGGATPKMIQMLLGHSTPHLALAVYTEVMEGDLAGAALDPTVVIGGTFGGSKSEKSGFPRGELEDE